MTTRVKIVLSILLAILFVVLVISHPQIVLLGMITCWVAVMIYFLLYLIYK